ncbi:MAG TPA: tRNA uridine-5-carboxymethylaminomethyl(34) synthesis GTPase MnmE [Microvirga sp.]
MSLSTDTIFAAASGQGRAAVHVIRISGPASRTILETLAAPLPPPRRLSLRVLSRPGSTEILDEALVAWMPGPGSFTGEDQAELHIHGGLATRAAVLRALADCPGCRPAEPGEFTRRAFLNGRMDLTRVEGLADLIDAETEAQRRQALRQLGGELGSATEAWREALLQGLALLEASLDFTDESDVPEELEQEVANRFREVHAQIGAVLARGSGERLRDGLTVVLAGPPNAGKSTLLNALARRDVAIVSPVPGTTRDAIEVRCDLGGWPVTFVDTAGLRESTDPVERIGMERARARAAEADLVLWLVPPEGAGEPPPVRVLPVATKADLAGGASAELQVSAATGAGMAELLDQVQQAAEHSFAGGEALLTRERHRLALERAHEGLARAIALIESGSALELAAEDARLAARAIGQITGRVDVEDVLDRLFAGFCIGK